MEILSRTFINFIKKSELSSQQQLSDEIKLGVEVPGSNLGQLLLTFLSTFFYFSMTVLFNLTRLVLVMCDNDFTIILIIMIVDPNNKLHYNFIDSMPY